MTSIGKFLIWSLVVAVCAVPLVAFAGVCNQMYANPLQEEDYCGTGRPCSTVKRSSYPNTSAGYSAFKTACDGFSAKRREDKGKFLCESGEADDNCVGKGDPKRCSCQWSCKVSSGKCVPHQEKDPPECSTKKEKGYESCTVPG